MNKQNFTFSISREVGEEFKSNCRNLGLNYSESLESLMLLFSSVFQSKSVTLVDLRSWFLNCSFSDSDDRIKDFVELF